MFNDLIQISDSIVYILPILLLVFFVIINLYFKIAERYEILDIPNERSSHKGAVVRGGGVVFAVAGVLGAILDPNITWMFLLGLVLISAVSFIDDLVTLGSKVRLGVQFGSLFLLCLELNFDSILWGIPLVLILMVAMVNAYNFMDGINGMNGLYTLSIILSVGLYSYIKNVDNQLIILFVCVSILVFLFYNYRTKAKCFSGDIGSVSLAFIVLYVLLDCFSRTYSYSLIIFPLLYGLDTFWTFLQRAKNKEKLTEAHRKHLYQLLVNELGLSHLLVSGIYGSVQLIINVFVILVLSNKIPFIKNELVLLSLLPLFSIFYIVIKYKVYQIVKSR